MQENLFDNALRDYLDDGELPLEEQEWSALSTRLDAHQQIGKAKKIVPFYYWMLPVAAMLSWLIVRYNGSDHSKNTVVPFSKNTSELAANQPSKTAVPSSVPVITATTQQTTVISSKATHLQKTNKQIIPSGTNQSLTQEEVAFTPAAATDTLSKSPATITFLNPPKQNNQRFDDPVYEEPERKTQKINIGINGGYNVGSQAKNDFTLGMAFRKSLGKRLRFEANVAVLTGGYSSYQTTVPSATSGSSVTPPSNNSADGNGPTGVGVGSAVGPSYAQGTNYLFYMQASPTVSYELLPGLSAGGGPDIQRLLSSSDKAIITNSQGMREYTQPDWDFGLAARMDYQINRKLRTGIVYRNSLRATSSNELETARRRYMLVQLSYSIF